MSHFDISFSGDIKWVVIVFVVPQKIRFPRSLYCKQWSESYWMLIWQTANPRKVLEGKLRQHQQPAVVAPSIIHGSKKPSENNLFFIFSCSFFIFMCKNKNMWFYKLAFSSCFFKGLNPFWLEWRRTTPASSCPPSTTSSTTRLRCSSTPMLPMGTTGDCGACTSSPRRSGWTRAMRRPLSGEGPGWWAASIINEYFWWNMDRPELWLIHVWNHQPQLL